MLNSKQKGKSTLTLKVRPTGDRILVEPVEEKAEKSRKGGKIIPDTAKEKPMESVVLPEGTLQIGGRCPPAVLFRPIATTGPR